MDDNQRVRRGDVLYRIDPRRFELAVESACASGRRRGNAAPARRGGAAPRQGSTTSCPRRTSGARGAPWPSPRPSCARRAGGAGVRRAGPGASVLRAPVARLHHHCAAPGRCRGRQAGRDDPGRRQLLDHRLFRGNQAAPDQPGARREIRLMGFESPLTGRVGVHRRGIADKTTAWAITPAGGQSEFQLGAAGAADSRAHRDRAGARGRAARRRMTCSVDVGEPGQPRVARGLLADWLRAMM